MGLVFIYPVIVADNSPCTDIYIFAYYGIAQIRKMPCLNALPKRCVLYLDEVSYTRSFLYLRPGTKPYKRPSLNLITKDR